MRTRGRVLSETVEDGAYGAEVEVERAAMLLLKATYHPNWRATVDGAEVATVMLMPSYVGVPVTPGTHQVRLEYQPGPLRGWLMLAGWLTLCLVALSERRRGQLALMTRPVAAAVGQVVARGQRGASAATRWKHSLAVGKHLRPHLPYLGALALMALLAGLPLLQLKIMSGHDALAYLPRQVEFFEGLKAGQIRSTMGTRPQRRLWTAAVRLQPAGLLLCCRAVSRTRNEFRRCPESGAICPAPVGWIRHVCAGR